MLTHFLVINVVQIILQKVIILSLLKVTIQHIEFNLNNNMKNGKFSTFLKLENSFDYNCISCALIFENNIFIIHQLSQDIFKISG